MKKQTMTKRYYATGSAIRAPQILMLLSQAIDKAEEYLEDTALEEYYVVEVVRIVKRAKQPIEVIEVRK